MRADSKIHRQLHDAQTPESPSRFSASIRMLTHGGSVGDSAFARMLAHGGSVGVRAIARMLTRLRKKSFGCPKGQESGVAKCIPGVRRTRLARLIASRFFRGDRGGLFRSLLRMAVAGDSAIARMRHPFPLTQLTPNAAPGSDPRASPASLEHILPPVRRMRSRLWPG
jgi:hypothetical protein